MQNPMDLTGQVFVITGAVRGIGLAIAEQFAQLGALVCGWDRVLGGAESDAAKSGGAAEPGSPFALLQQVDVTQPEQTEAACAAVLEKFGRLDGIIANAGINGPTKPLWEYSPADWQQVMDVNLSGVFFSVQPVLRHLRQTGRGRIVIISSVGGKEGNPGAVPYGASKAGVIGFAKGLAKEVLPSQITVNCIAPAMAETDLLTGMSADYIADKKSRIPMGRLCTPGEIASMTAFVASQACSFTTGQVFDVTGGRATW